MSSVNNMFTNHVEKKVRVYIFVKMCPVLCVLQRQPNRMKTKCKLCMTCIKSF